MTKKTFNNSLLTEYIERDNAKLIDTYNNLHRLSRINFICNCNNTTSKTFRMIVEGHGAFCIKCDKEYSKNNALQTTTNTNVFKWDNRILYTKELLDKLIIDNNATLISYPDNIKSDSIINYTCNCGTIYSKTFRQAYNISGLYCNTCTYKNQQYKSNRKLYDLALLTNIIESNNLELISYEKLTKNSIITFKCKCETISSKKFFNLSNFPYCDKCTEELKLKNMQKTCEIRYGVRNPTQNFDILHKAFTNSKKFKDYILPSGKVIKIQGYENIALDELLQKYLESDIHTGKYTPRIKYYKQETQSEHMYFPDIFIKSINKIIEVKSTWTYKKELDVNTLKGNACKNNGYNFEFWIYDNKLNKIIKTI
jgi:hypothetical protein